MPAPRNNHWAVWEISFSIFFLFCQTGSSLKPGALGDSHRGRPNLVTTRPAAPGGLTCMHTPYQAPGSSPRAGQAGLAENRLSGMCRASATGPAGSTPCCTEAFCLCDLDADRLPAEAGRKEAGNSWASGMRETEAQ